MRKILLALCLTFAASSLVHAKEGTAPTPQQERMASCNKEAKEKNLAGAERKKFMSECLKGQSAAAAKKELTPQQQRMADCNKEAKEKNLAGAERKKFMSECLKKK